MTLEINHQENTKKINVVDTQSITTVYVILDNDVFLFCTESAKIADDYQRLGYEVIDFPIPLGLKNENRSSS